VSGKTAENDVLRLDKWLWFARFCKTRALAQKHIEGGDVTLNGAKTRKTSANVRIGDEISVVLGPIKRTVTVLLMAERRGPASEAQTLYEEKDPPEKLRGLDAGLRRHKPLLSRPKGAGRPTKKDRRSIAKELGGRWDD